MKLLIVFCLLLSQFRNIFVGAGATNYYWRDFYGVLSSFEDNFVAGEEPKNTIFVGQVYCPDVGILFARITTGSFLQSPCQGATPGYAPKMLCTDQPLNFRWLATSSQTYKTDIKGKDPVQGGFFISNSSVAHVGRSHSVSGFMIGSIKVTDDLPTLTYLDPFTKETFAVSGFFDVLIYKAGR